MMMGLLRKVTPFVGLLGIVSCGGGDSGTDPGPVEDPDFPADFATSYTMVADARTSNPHPLCIEVFCNPGSASDYSSGTYPLTVGTILVKATHSDPLCAGAPSGFVSMKKLASGSSPATGDWYWQELDANRNVTNSNDKGNIQACLGCHIDCSLSDDWTCVDPGTRL